MFEEINIAQWICCLKSKDLILLCGVHSTNTKITIKLPKYIQFVVSVDRVIKQLH